MCGLTLIASHGPICVSSAKLAHSLIEYRGIDGTSHITCNIQKVHVCAFHSRLAIQGLHNEEAVQPKNNARYLMVYNGEIFNAKEIARTYSINESSSDTELLWILVNRGLPIKRVLEQIDGFFAVAIIDKEESTIYCARDRLGQKPLYTFTDGGRLIVSSGIKPILSYCQSTGRAVRMKSEAVSIFLATGIVPTDCSVGEGLVSVSAGELISIRLQQNLVVRHDSLKEFSDEYSKSTDTSFLSGFRESCKRIKAQEVRDGILLSHGLDSGLVASQMEPTDAYTFIGANTSADERYCIEETAKSYGHYLHEVNELEITSSIMMELILSAQSLFEDPGLFSIYTLIRKIPSSTRVLYTGDGADELFFGYRRQSRLALSKKIIKLVETASKIVKPQLANRMSLLLELASSIDLRIAHIISTDDERLINAVIPLLIRMIKIYDQERKGKGAVRTEDVYHYIDFNLILSQKLLRKSDMASMLGGKEVRSPFLQECAIKGIPYGEVKRPWLHQPTKPYLRFIAKEIGLPAAKIRSKTGFGTSQIILEKFANNFREEAFFFLRNKGYVKDIRKYLEDPRHVIRTLTLSGFDRFCI